MNWICPHCDHASVIANSNYRETTSILNIENADNFKALITLWIVCPNPNCNKYSLKCILTDADKPFANSPIEPTTTIKMIDIVPNAKYKSFPNYIPNAILQDYNEACLIVNLSPKASATISRRCLQGMIRDFFNISKPRLIDEINAIKDIIDPLTWQAIDSVRQIGNIGAHMEKDINLIIDVEPNEAQLLINLIEHLIQEWYIHRHQRQKQLEKIIEINAEKQDEKKGISQ